LWRKINVILCDKGPVDVIVVAWMVCGRRRES